MHVANAPGSSQGYKLQEVLLPPVSKLWTHEDGTQRLRFMQAWHHQIKRNKQLLLLPFQLLLRVLVPRLLVMSFHHRHLLLGRVPDTTFLIPQGILDCCCVPLHLMAPILTC